MPILEPDIEDRVIAEATALRNVSGNDIEEVEWDWFENALSEFVDGLSRKEKWLLRRRTWEMLCTSAEKHCIAENVITDLYDELGDDPEDQGVYDSLCIAILGSVARLEAEQHSDIDVDIVIDHDTDAHRDWIYEEFIRPGSRRVGMIRAEQAHDMRIIGFDDLEAEDNNDDYDHLIKLFQAAAWVVEPQSGTQQQNRYLAGPRQSESPRTSGRTVRLGTERVQDN